MQADSSSEYLIDWLSFSYLTAEKATVYRAIVQIFADAKAEFVLHLRPSQVRESLCANGWSVESIDIEASLQQLEVWGNLQSYQDRSDAPSLVEYYRKSLLYQMTAAGEAAYASTLTFIQRLDQQAKLDARALDRIAEGAGQLERLARSIRDDVDSYDFVVVLTTIRNICQDADELTSRAQSFFRWLHEQTESERSDLESFLSYKEQLIEYLRHFVSELISRGAKIAKRLGKVSNDEYAQLAHIAAEEELGDPRVGEEADHSRRISDEESKWRQRLMGLRGWFSRSGGNSAQLDQLRAAARAAIPRLLQLAAQMNERETGKSDRVADLRRLAESFLQCKDDAQSHRLFRAAFALSPARHLRVDQATIDARDQQPIPSETRWLDADAIEFSPQLKNTGRESAASVSRKVVDRSKALATARRRLETESGREDSSRETLIALGRRRLSEIGELDVVTFRFLLELLELAVPRPALTPPSTMPVESSTESRLTNEIVKWSATEESRIETRSRDGSVCIVVESITDVDQHIATIANPLGQVMLADRWVEVQRAR